MAHQQMRVCDVSEDELLAAFTPHLPRSSHALVDVGDDCAVIHVPTEQLCVSTDVLVENHHFVTDFSTPQQIGARAAAQNLADVAAMGAVPQSLVVGLVMPPDTTVEWVKGLAQGFAQACRECGAGVVGGDLSAGPTLMISVTVMGQCPQGLSPVLRTGAQAGDLIIHAGTLGRSAAGLALMKAGISMAHQCGQAQASAEEALRIFRAPQPPLALGPVMARAGVRAMMDVSDSLVRDLDRMAKASGVVMVLDELHEAHARHPGGPALGQDLVAVLPIAHSLCHRSHDGAITGESRDGDGDSASSTSTSQPSDGEVTGTHHCCRDAQACDLARSWVLTGGEDHGLVATIAPQDWQRSDLASYGVRVIGHVDGSDRQSQGMHRAHDPASAHDCSAGDTRVPGVYLGQHPAHDLGWDHFTSRS